MNFGYIEKFKSMSVGLFVHFGLYSVLGKGEWYFSTGKLSPGEYENVTKKFRIPKTWAKELVQTAKELGAKYITLTTRHHDGFSLYDTCGLSDYDAPHSACGRDLIAEFVGACREGGILPFFYHTLLDWHNPDYRENFPEYMEYLIRSVEILCQNYGKIGGFWFDGMWDKPHEDWQEDRLYATIRKYQPEAMIINNTGLSEQGKVGHPEIDSVTFERGKPSNVDCSDKPRAGEMCQVLNDHWGYAQDDCNYKSVKALIEDLIDCRASGCNYLLNTGLRGNGSVNSTDKSLLREVGKWIEKNREFVYLSQPCRKKAKNAVLLQGKDSYYAVVKDVPMSADPNVVFKGTGKEFALDKRIKIQEAVWLDSGERVEIYENNTFRVKPFEYGMSLFARVAKIKAEK